MTASPLVVLSRSFFAMTTMNHVLLYRRIRQVGTSTVTGIPSENHFAKLRTCAYRVQRTLTGFTGMDKEARVRSQWLL